jgi:hypothetical protein
MDAFIERRGLHRRRPKLDLGPIHPRVEVKPYGWIGTKSSLVRRSAGWQGGVPVCQRRAPYLFTPHGLTSRRRHRRSPPRAKGTTLPSAASVSGGRAQLHPAIVFHTNSRPPQRAPFQRSSCTVAWSCPSERRVHAEGVRHTSSP